MVIATMTYWFWAHRAPMPSTVVVGDANANADADANANAKANAKASASANADAGTMRIDAARREELRKKIFAGMWANAEPDAPVPAGGFGGPPPKAGELNADYIQERLKDDFRPMARDCYKELLARAPDAGGGKLLVKFTIVGDEKVGGIVESAELDPSSTIQDAKLETCIKESMLTMQFAPPAKGGSVTVVAPIAFASVPPSPSSRLP